MLLYVVVTLSFDIEENGYKTSTSLEEGEA